VTKNRLYKGYRERGRMYSQEKLSEARECLCFSSWDSNFSLCEERNGQFNLAFGEERAGSAKSQEESRQRKCAMMISLWFLYLAVFMFVQVISALLHLLVSWLVEKCKVHKDHCIFLCVFSFESIHGATFECSSMVLLSFRVNYV
jgi:hypothetical protein